MISNIHPLYPSENSVNVPTRLLVRVSDVNAFLGGRQRCGSTPVNRGHAAIAIVGCSFSLGGCPWRLGATQGGRGPLSSNSSCRVQRWFVTPAAMAGVRSCHFRGVLWGAASRRLS